jgi:2-C-methyl-D-erythritol 4-phosphate cytidylyltransferase
VRAGAILLCAGRGERLGAGVPKAFVPLAGRPLFAWSLAALQRCTEIAAIVVVGPLPTTRELLAASGGAFERVTAFVEGGEQRQHSVARGLAALDPACDLVAVHDAARALVTPGVIRRALEGGARHGAALAAVPLSDTLKSVAGGRVTGTPPRDGLWLAQTPQVFRRDWLEAAHAAAPGLATDDAALVEALGHPVHVAEGDPLNFKITTPADLARAEAWLRDGARDAEAAGRDA